MNGWWALVALPVGLILGDLFGSLITGHFYTLEFIRWIAS